MKNEFLVCPHCLKEIEMEEAFFHDLQEKHRKEIEGLVLKSKQEKESLKKELEKEWRDQIAKELIEEFSQKDQERESLVAFLRKEVIQLKGKLEQTSSQFREEVLELQLEDCLKGLYPYDEILPVPKGLKGADIIQKVKKSGNFADIGTVLWESKKTKSFSFDWVKKLKEDMRRESADVGVIITSALPKDEEKIFFHQGVWVAHVSLIKGVSQVVRKGLLQVFQAKKWGDGHQEKASLLYEYFLGPHFKNRLESILLNYRYMKEDLEKEKRSLMRSWKVREKQLEQLLENTVEMCGEIQGTVGRDEFSLPSLEFPEGP